MELDGQDMELLDLIQRDASMTVKDLASRVGLSANACWRRIQGYEERGYILNRAAILDPVKLGLGTTVFVSVRAAEHSAAWVTQFSKAVTSIPEVVEFYRMAGDVDYLMKLRVSGIAHYDAIYQALIAKVRLIDVSAAFAMEEVKNVTVIPVTAMEQTRLRPNSLLSQENDEETRVIKKARRRSRPVKNSEKTEN